MKIKLKDNEHISSIEERILSVLVSPCLLSAICKLSSLPRSTTEYNLKKLLEKKYIGTKKHGKRNLYFKLNKTYENLSRQKIPVLKVGKVTIYQGSSSIDLLWQEIASMPEESRLTGIQPRKSFRKALERGPKEMVYEVSKGITDKRFIFDAIVHEDMARSIFEKYGPDGDVDRMAKAFTGRLEDLVKVDSNFLDEKAEFYMIDNFIAFIDWYSEIAVKIEDENIVNLMKSVYSAVKAYGTRYHQGQFIEKLLKNKEK